MRSYALTATALEHDADAVAQFDHLLGRLTGTEEQQATHGEVQAMVHTQGSELLRRLIQGHLDQRGSEEPPRERVVGADGSARTQRREGCKRRLETRFGEVIVTRRGYGGRGLESVFPLDAEPLELLGLVAPQLPARRRRRAPPMLGPPALNLTAVHPRLRATSAIPRPCSSTSLTASRLNSSVY